MSSPYTDGGLDTTWQVGRQDHTCGVGGVGCPLWPHIHRKGHQGIARGLVGTPSPRRGRFWAAGWWEMYFTHCCVL